MVPLPWESALFDDDGTIRDLRFFLRCTYIYWAAKGYAGVIANSVVNFTNMLFLFLVIVLLTVFFNWEEAATCTESTCRYTNLLQRGTYPCLGYKTLYGRTAAATLLVATFLMTLYHLEEMVKTYFITREVHAFVQGEVNSNWACQPPQCVPSMPWCDFLAAVCTKVNERHLLKYCRARRSNRLSVRLALCALLQTENYVTVLYRRGVAQKGSLRLMNADMIASLVDNAVHNLGHLESAPRGSLSFGSHVYVRLVVYLAFYMCITSYQIVKLLVIHVAEIRGSFGVLLKTGWNENALWTFRRYNEATHQLEARMGEALELATQMRSKICAPSSMSRLVRRVSGTCVVVVLALSVLNSALLVSGKLLGVHIMWWLTTALLLFHGVSEPDLRMRDYDYSADLATLTQLLRHDDPTWHRSEGAFVADMQKKFLSFRGWALAVNLLRTFAYPFILLCAFRDGTIQSLMQVVEANSERVDGLGIFLKESLCSSEEDNEGEGEGEGASVELASRLPSLPLSFPRSHLTTTKTVTTTTATTVAEFEEVNDLMSNDSFMLTFPSEDVSPR